MSAESGQDGNKLVMDRRWLWLPSVLCVLAAVTALAANNDQEQGVVLWSSATGFLLWTGGVVTKQLRIRRTDEPERGLGWTTYTLATGFVCMGVLRILADSGTFLVEAGLAMAGGVNGLALAIYFAKLWQYWVRRRRPASQS